MLSLISDYFGIKKDRIEKEKVELELDKLKTERKSLIQKTNFEDVMKYDHKIINLVDIIKNNPVIIYLTAIVFGFTVGIGAFQLIIKIAKLDLVQENLYVMKEHLPEKYVTKSEFESLKQQYELLLRENHRLSQLKYKSQMNLASIQEKKKYLLKLKELIDEGNSYYQSDFKDFNFENWKNECIYLLESIDKLLGTAYKPEFMNITGHLRSQVFLNHSSVGRSLVILKTIRDILDLSK